MVTQTSFPVAPNQTGDGMDGELHHQWSNKLSMNYIGCRRLLAIDLLDLEKGDKVSLVVPINKKGEPAIAKMEVG